jgi:hypothetical protein
MLLAACNLLIPRLLTVGHLEKLLLWPRAHAKTPIVYGRARYLLTWTVVFRCALYSVWISRELAGRLNPLVRLVILLGKRFKHFGHSISYGFMK